MSKRTIPDDEMIREHVLFRIKNLTRDSRKCSHPKFTSDCKDCTWELARREMAAEIAGISTLSELADALK